MSRSSEIVDAVIIAMGDRPDDFTVRQHTLDDEKTGMRFWIANTCFDGGVYEPFEMRFNPIQSVRFHHYVKRLKSWKATSALSA